MSRPLQLPSTQADREALQAVELFARRGLVYVRRRRKTQPRGPLEPDEVQALQRLGALADAVSALRDQLTNNNP